MQLPALLPPAPTGLLARYFGAVGTTNRYYWVRANFPSGRSALAGPVLVSNTVATLDLSSQVEVLWDHTPGAISYDVLQTTSSTLPTVAATILNVMGLEQNSYTDKGDTLASYTPWPHGMARVGPGLFIGHFQYNSAVDGLAQGAITLAKGITIPAGTIILGGGVRVSTAFTSGGSATVALGTSAGSSATSLLAATAVASLTANANLNLVPVFATPLRLTADAPVIATVATADLLTGALEGFMIGYTPIG